MEKRTLTGHLLAIFSILVWGTTFIVTKLLLEHFSPAAILFYRFLIGYLMLWILYPHRLKTRDFKEEFMFFISGASGVTIYFLCENFALTYTYASNVSIIVATAPFLTGLFAHFISKEKMKKSFVVGFILAIAGIAIISFNGSLALHLNPLGDILALGASVCWAAYSLVTVYVSRPEYSSIAVTRRIFFYGLVSMIPALWICDYNFDTTYLLRPDTLGMIGYLGIIASGLCYIAWNKAMTYLGAVKTSVYIYLIPVITMIFSFFILGEKMTLISVGGCILILAGLFLSERK